MGSTPLDDEIPVELSDLPLDIQEILYIYNRMKDEWDTFNGIYLGKSYTGIFDMFNVLQIPVEDRKSVLDWLFVIDEIRSDLIRNKKAAESSTKPSK